MFAGMGLFFFIAGFAMIVTGGIVANDGIMAGGFLSLFLGPLCALMLFVITYDYDGKEVGNGN